MSPHRAMAVSIALCCSLGSFALAADGGPARPLPVPDPLATPSILYDTDPSPLDGQPLDLGIGPGPLAPFGNGWSWQILPDGLMYPAYLAGGRESRFSTQWFHERDKGWLWDIALGTHVGILRYGSWDPLRPEGWQLDAEGAAFPRLTLDDRRELVSTDFRFGMPMTFRQGPVEAKFGYYHISAHMGDEIMVRRGSLDRINYTRDALMLGLALRPHDDLRLYAETGWAFYTGGGSEPWEFQFGVDYSPTQPNRRFATPFFAINTRVREEVDFGGNMTVQTGLQWRGNSGQLFRAGLHYFNGKTDQYEFFREHEQQIGIGAWYDF